MRNCCLPSKVCVMDGVDFNVSLNSPGRGPQAMPMDSTLIMFIGVGRSIITVVGTNPLAGNTGHIKWRK